MSKIEKALRKARAHSPNTQKGASKSQVSQKLIDSPEETEASGQAGVPVVSKSASSNLVEGTSESAATIPFMQQPALLDAQSRQLQKIIYPEAAENETITALREIRTKILKRTESKNCVIMVTGTSLRSGATFVTINLATAFALDASRTALAIDCNIRDPYLHQLVNGEIKSGLTNFLTDNRGDVADIIQPTGISRLRVIPAGVNIDPTVEYFTMERMRRLIRSVRERYPDRNVLLDCPPISRSADAQILQQLCDYVLVVVPYARATPSMVQAALKHIDPKKLLGVILNEEPVLPELDWKSATIKIMIDIYQRFVRTISRWKNKAGSALRRTG